MRRLPFDPDTTTSGRGHLRAIRDLLPYLWPRGRRDLRARVIISIFLLIGAKVTIVFVPFLYGAAVDRLTSGADNLLILPILDDSGSLIGFAMNLAGHPKPGGAPGGSGWRKRGGGRTNHTKL